MHSLQAYHFERAGIRAANRLALAPMTNMQSHADGQLSEAEYRFLCRRAEGGFGIIITCAAHVALDGQGWPGELGIFSDALLPGLSRLAQGLRAAGSLSLVQLYHGGARSPQDLIGQQPWSASAHSFSQGGKTVEVRAASEEEIETCIRQFIQAAQRAHQAGFDGVELHAAHGYLLQQFLSTTTNQREDQWGGSLENRSRIIREIVRGIRQSLPPSFLVFVRLSPESKYSFQGIDFEEMLELSCQLKAWDVDGVHVSPWDAFKKPEAYPDGDKTILEYYREALPSDLALMVAGLIRSAEEAERAMALGADFLALGRVALGVPDWPQRAAKGLPIALPPYTAAQLEAAELSPVFVNYMRRWEGFVLD